MQFLKIETALRRLAGESETGGKYYQIASLFEGVLKDTGTTPEEKATKIASIIENGTYAESPDSMG